MAELNINERQAGDVTVLDMSGKITIGEGSVALRSAIRRLIDGVRERPEVREEAARGAVAAAPPGALLCGALAAHRQTVLVDAHV